MQHNTSPSHRVYQAVYCGLLSHFSSTKLQDIGGNWSTLLYTSIQSIPTEVSYDSKLQSSQDPGEDGKRAEELP
jgi:hypothetical protein